MCLQDVENEVPGGSLLGRPLKQETVWTTGGWGVVSRGSGAHSISCGPPGWVCGPVRDGPFFPLGTPKLP